MVQEQMLEKGVFYSILFYLFFLFSCEGLGGMWLRRG